MADAGEVAAEAAGEHQNTLPPGITMQMQGIAPPKPLDLSSASTIDNWKTWKQMWENYSIVAGINRQPEHFKIALFLHSIGPDALKVYNTFVYTEAENRDDIKIIIKKFDDFIIGESNEIYERYLFNKRSQESTESIENYTTVLRTMAKSCNFCDCLHDQLIRDRMVLGVRDQQTRKKLLQERNLTLQRCIDICKSAEITSSQLKSMGGQAEEIHKVNFSKKKTDGGSREIDCKFCGLRHQKIKEKCPAWGKVCLKCKRKNHFAKKCTKKGTSRKSVNAVTNDDEYSDDSEVELIQTVETVGQIITSKNKKSIFAEMEIGANPVRFQVDCGATVNILPKKYVGSNKIEKTSKVVQMWNRDKLKPEGTCRLIVKNRKTKKKYSVEFIVVKESLTPLIGASAAQQMKLITVNTDHFKQVNILTESQMGEDKNDIFKSYADVFDGGLGRLPGKAHLQVDPTVTPVIAPLRRTAVSLKPKLKQELERLQKMEVIQQVDEPTDWVSQFVTRTKKSGDLRICIDPGQLDKALKREHYQLPIIEEVLPELAQAKVFSKLDLASGYWHIELDEESSLLTTFNTPFGRYKWRRLPFGICVSSEIFQKRLHQALEGLDGVLCIADDIIVYGKGETLEDANRNHDQSLQNLLQRCRDKGIKLNKEKTELRKSEICFIGHRATKDGLGPDPSKIEVIKNLPKPTDVAGVRRFSGFVNYLAKFLPNLSDVMEPIRQLTRSDVEWHWDDPQETAFQKVKELVMKAPVLAYYDPSQELDVECDASERGLGAVLTQNGKPVAYASRALTDTETRYAQIEKEMLAIVYALEKFHQYTYGRRVTVYSDHQPLETIIQKPLCRAPRRLQRMLLRTHNYDIQVRYKKGTKMFTSDMLSRAYLPLELNGQTEFERVNMVKFLPIREERLNQIREATQQDETMQLLKDVILHGWPESKVKVHTLLTPYFSSKDELSLQDGFIFKGERVVIPESLRSIMKEKIHSSHLGIEGCLRRARECIYWPNMTSDMRQYISSCETCRKYETSQGKETLMSHEVPDRMWQKVGTDLFQMDDKDFLLTVDYYSNFWEIDRLEDTRSATVIRKLKNHFSRYGIPEQLVSDNGPQFSSEKFENFAKTYDFEHLTSSPGYPQSNGKAESDVKVAKQLLKKAKDSGRDQYLAILDYRNTPTQGVNSSPAQRMLNRRTRTLLPTAASLLEPRHVDIKSERSKLKTRQDKQATYYNRSAKDLPPLCEGDVVRLKPFKLGEKKWNKGVIQHRLDERSYEVETDDGTYRRNRVHLKKSNEGSSTTDREIRMQPMNVEPTKLNNKPEDTTSNTSVLQSPKKSAVSNTEVKMEAPAPRRSQRVSKPPSRFGDFIVNTKK